MKLCIIVGLATWCAVVASATASAQAPAGFWSFLEFNRPISRCAEDSDAHQAAGDRVTLLEEQLSRLKPSDDHAAALESLHALLKTECFLFASEMQALPHPDSAASLKDWVSRGAMQWLWSYLDYPKYATPLRPHVVLPPDARPTLTREHARDHALSPYLCSSSDPNCGVATRGWRARAERGFGAPLEREIDLEHRISDECDAKASSEPADRQYMAWHACVESRKSKTSTFPIGEFQAPSAGWLVITGRRRTYESCDSTSAYNLESGAAVVSERCSARGERVVGGKVSIESLREAVWMMLFTAEVKPMLWRAQAFPLPRSVEPKIYAGASPMTVEGGPISSSISMLTWRLIVPGGRSYAGLQAWPRSYDRAEDHAASLIEVVEHGIVEGCMPRQAPAPVVMRATRFTALAPELHADVLQRDYEIAFARWRSLKPCTIR
jgi:hypothetical protein